MKRYLASFGIAALVSLCLSGCGGINIYINGDGKGGVQAELADSTEETTEVISESENNDEEETTENSDEELFKKLEAEKDGVKVSVERLEEWEGEKEKYAKFDITIQNNGEKDIKGWSMECAIGDSFEVEQIWGGKYEIEDGRLKITPEAYTEEIKTEGKVNFGFNSKNTGEKPNISGFTFKSENIELEG